jgi:hypothetical protein
MSTDTSITSKDLKDLRQLIFDLNSLLTKITPKSESRFKVSTSATTGQSNNNYLSDWITPSSACQILNVDMTTLQNMMLEDNIEHRKTREGITQVNKESVISFIKSQDCF